MSIEVIQLKKSFGEREILRGINVTFEKGKINMIIGASGSGKSVMLKCMVGIYYPDHGKVLYNGRNIHELRSKDKRSLSRQMGMLFQSSALFDSLTVEDNVAFPLKMFTTNSKAQILDRVNYCLNKVQLSNANHLFPAALSGGMQKRVGIARAIALNPQYLFVDEPNSGLDPLTASVIDKLIKELTEEFDMTTVIVSHDLNSMLNIGDNIMFLYKGEKAWQGSKVDLLQPDHPALEEFVFVSDLIKR